MGNNAKQRTPAVGVYSRMLTRVEHSLADAESQTWESVKAEIDKAIEFEQELAEFTQDELSLIRNYLRRDLQNLTHYAAETGHGLREWLQMDLDLIESGLRNSLLSIADKTQVEQENLALRLSNEVEVYMAGEVACPGKLHCTTCGAEISLLETAQLEPCHHCDGLYFQRIPAVADAKTV